MARPPSQTCCAVLITSSGSPVHSTRSALRPTAIVPRRSSTPSACAGTRVRPARPASQGRPLATALPASWRTLRALCEASPDWVNPTSTPASCSNAALRRVAPIWSKLEGRSTSASTNTGTRACAICGASCQASAPPAMAMRTRSRAAQRSNWRMSAARSTWTMISISLLIYSSLLFSLVFLPTTGGHSSTWAPVAASIVSMFCSAHPVTRDPGRPHSRRAPALDSP